jgi:hypothetical protein
MTTESQPSAEGAGPDKQGQFNEAVKQRKSLRRRTLFRPDAAAAETSGTTRVAYVQPFGPVAAVPGSRRRGLR